MLAESLLQDQNSISNKVIKLEHQSQVNLNARLDNMRFNDYSESEFNSTKPHKENEISFVTTSSGEISMYKGDVLLSGKGGELQITYAYVTDKNRGQGSAEQDVGYRNFYGNEGNTIIYTGAKGNQKIGNFIVSGLQVGLDSNFDLPYHKDGQMIFASAFAGGLCPYLSFNVYRKNGSIMQTETLEYWITLEEVRFISSEEAIKVNGLVTPDEYKYYYAIKGRRTIQGDTTIVQEFDISSNIEGVPLIPFESTVFNYAVAEHGDNAVSFNGLRLACSDVKYAPDYGEIKDPILTVNFTSRPFYTTIDKNPYVGSTKYLKETENRPFGLRFDPETGEKLNSPILRFGNDIEKEMAYVISFRDDEEVKP